jgi:hypothetical protein
VTSAARLIVDVVTLVACVALLLTLTIARMSR